jgi:hypothetical protein
MSEETEKLLLKRQLVREFAVDATPAKAQADGLWDVEVGLAKREAAHGTGFVNSRRRAPSSAPVPRVPSPITE